MKRITPKGFDVQKLFIQAAKDKLPFMVGRAYAEVVVKCLTGHFDLSETPDGRMTQGHIPRTGQI